MEFVTESDVKRHWSLSRFWQVDAKLNYTDDLAGSFSDSFCLPYGVPIFDAAWGVQLSVATLRMDTEVITTSAIWQTASPNEGIIRVWCNVTLYKHNDIMV